MRGYKQKLGMPLCLISYWGKEMAEGITVNLKINKLDCLRAGIACNQKVLILVAALAFFLAVLFDVLLYYKNLRSGAGFDTAGAIWMLVFTLLTVTSAAIFGAYAVTETVMTKTGCLGHERIVNFRRDGYLEITDNASNPQNTVNPIKLRGKFRKNDNYYLLHEKNKYVPDLILPRRCFQDDGDFTGLALILRGNGMDEP